MQEIVNLINSQASIFAAESQKQLNGNKSAGARARKASNELTKLLKQFRAESTKYASAE